MGVVLLSQHLQVHTNAALLAHANALLEPLVI